MTTYGVMMPKIVLLHSCKALKTTLNMSIETLPLPPPPKVATYWYVFTRLYIFNEWLHAITRDGDMYTEEFLLYRIEDGIQRKLQTGTPGKGMLKSSRDGVIRLIDKKLCVYCDSQVSSPLSTGDHIVPLHEGGEDSLDNFLPSCRSCNSSKGKKDMVKWWISHKGRNISDLMKKDPAILRAYLRVMTKHLEKNGLLHTQAAADYHIKALEQLSALVKNTLILQQILRWYEMDNGIC
jgi:hypothetical protein